MTEVAEQGIVPTTQLEFLQAMKDFTTMFPQMDPDVIEEVSISLRDFTLNAYSFRGMQARSSQLT